MGFFRRLRQRLRPREWLASENEPSSSSSSSSIASISSDYRCSESSTLDVFSNNVIAPPPPLETIASLNNTRRYGEPVLRQALDEIPDLLRDLQTAPETGCDQAARSLRKLFALSEYGTSASHSSSSGQTEPIVPPARLDEIRSDMIADGTVVSTLLQFVERCRTERKRRNSSSVSKALCSETSSQLSLALLVLNNISIPVANKRYIALDQQGMKCLCRLLCDDPSCRIVVIVLVNLTFCDATLRRDVVCAHDIHLFQALTFACRVASMTVKEYKDRKHLWSTPKGGKKSSNPSEHLASLMKWDEKFGHKKATWPAMSEQIFPDTARWCVCAMQNLTRSGPDGTANPAAFTLIHTGVVPYLLRCINIGGSLSPSLRRRETEHSFSSSTGTGDSTPELAHPNDVSSRSTSQNHPSIWVKETAQDAALFVILNLSTVPSARKFILNTDNNDGMDAVSILSAITDQNRLSAKGKFGLSEGENELTRLQCMKARMALAFLLGSDTTLEQQHTMTDASELVIEALEVEQLTQVLGHTLYRRSKPPPGGYSATTFSLKYILWSIQCLLLSQPRNQEQFAESGMDLINALFVKILALYALQGASYIDGEAAGYACTCLYLLSHYGFHACYLPRSLGKGHGVRSLVTKILFALYNASSTNRTTQYVVRQLLRRIPYLLCTDAAAVVPVAGSRTGNGRSALGSIHPDYRLESPLIVSALAVVDTIGLGAMEGSGGGGAIPRTDIFNRSVQRRRLPRPRHSGTSIIREVVSDDDEDDTAATVSVFANALAAARELVFANALHWDSETDEIGIANTIAQCCEGEGDATVVGFGFGWRWNQPLSSLTTTHSPADSSCSTDTSRCHSFLSLAGAILTLPHLCGTASSSSNDSISP